jgi:hypothetical protein
MKRLQEIENKRRGIAAPKPSEPIPVPPPPFDPTGWLFYCENCDTRRTATLDAHPGTAGPLMAVQPFFDLICSECKAILLTIEPAGA